VIVGAGVTIVRGGRLLLSPRGPSPHLPSPAEPRVHLGWIGCAALPGESFEDCARREAREEIGCEVELLDSEPLVVVRGELAVFRARALGEPRPVDVPSLAWVPVTLLPRLRDGVPVEGLSHHGVEVLGEIGSGIAFIGDGSVTGALRGLVERLGPAALA
jgi:8-oxo-dGTP pyrophosphatase MutT (NUDIX family)